MAGTATAADWNLPLTVSSGTTRTGAVFGIASQATNGYDTGLDSQNPFTDELLNAYFSHPEWNLVKSGKPVSSFYRDVRGTIPQDFLLTVKTTLTPVTVSWDKNIIPATTSASISDGYKTVDMQKSTSFSYSPTSGISTLTIKVAPGDSTPPAVPSGLDFKATDSTINLYWTPNTEADLAGYRLYFYDNQGTVSRKLDLKSASNYNLLNVPADTTYTVAVSAYDSTGNESQKSGTIAAVRRLPAVNGLCGSSNGTTLSTAPTTNLCTTGTATGVTGSGPWNWSCTGSNGGTTATCSAQLTAPPAVTSFQIPAYSKLTISITDLKATASSGVAGYLITENATTPTATNTSWKATAPSSYTASSATVKTLYAWAKDSTGRISAAKSATTIIDTTIPVVTAFSLPATSKSLTVTISKFTASDNYVTIAGYKLTESATAPQAQDSSWNSAKPTSFTFASGGSKTLYAWVEDQAGNVSLSRNAKVTIDLTAPTVTAFTLPATVKGTKITVTSFKATDDVAVTGYMITESATAPTATASGWKSSAPTSYTVSGKGSKTLYGWARDAVGNVSISKSASVAVQ